MSALSLSESVPLDKIAFRKCVSDELFPVKVEEAWYAAASALNKEAARLDKVDICAADGVAIAF